MNRLLLNAVVFQLGWFCCVLYGSSLALLYAAVALILHLFYVVRPAQRRSELLLIVVVAAIGWITDYFFIAAQVLQLPQPGGSSVADVAIVPPLWLSVIWILFATTLRHCLVWLAKSLPVCALLGAITGPLNYLAGAQLAGGGLAEPLAVSIAVLALTWAVLLPLIALLIKRSIALDDALALKLTTGGKDCL